MNTYTVCNYVFIRHHQVRLTQLRATGLVNIYNELSPWF